MKLETDSKGDFFVEPSVLADRLGLGTDELRRRMRLGLVTSTVEDGSGQDEGRRRLTVRSGNSVWRAIVDSERTVLSEEAFTLGRGTAG